jgi:hypothetical protein
VFFDNHKNMAGQPETAVQGFPDLDLFLSFAFGLFFAQLPDPPGSRCSLFWLFFHLFSHSYIIS